MTKSLMFSLMVFLSFLMVSAGFDEDVEHLYQPQYADSAYGSLENFLTKRITYPWPFALTSIGHTIASYQNYGGSAYFHHGIDIMAPADTPVSTPTGGKVVSIVNYGGGSKYYWEVAVQDNDGFIWQFHHIKKESIPQEIHDAFDSGEPIVPGTIIGTIIPWSSSAFGELFHHIHLNVLGEGKQYVNPFLFLEPLPDHDIPIIEKIGLFQNNQLVAGNEIEGNYSLYVNVSDLILHTKYIVPPYSLTYSLDNLPEKTVWKFDGLPGKSSDTLYLKNYYIESQTCGDYNCRRFYINLGFNGSGNDYFTATPGYHHIAVTATDFTGNSTTENYVWKVKGEIEKTYQLIGTWPGIGIWEFDWLDQSWMRYSKTEPAKICCQEMDGIELDDLTVWLKENGEIWTRYEDGFWKKKTGAYSDLIDFTIADVNDDQLNDFILSNGTGLWVEDRMTGQWILLSKQSPKQILCADFNQDGWSDIMTVFPTAVWIRYSQTALWEKQAINTSDLITLGTGDVNQDGLMDLIGSFSSGMWWRDAVSSAWSKLSNNSPDLITTGDLDGDGVDDLIFSFKTLGVWGKYSAANNWARISASAALNLDIGFMKTK
jgi:hypothetical protein